MLFLETRIVWCLTAHGRNSLLLVTMLDAFSGFHADLQIRLYSLPIDSSNQFQFSFLFATLFPIRFRCKQYVSTLQSSNIETLRIRISFMHCAIKCSKRKTSRLQMGIKFTFMAFCNSVCHIQKRN